MRRGAPNKFEMSNPRNYPIRNRYRYSLESSLGSEYASRWFSNLDMFCNFVIENLIQISLIHAYFVQGADVMNV